MALSEQEEFELLQLERERSLAQTAVSNQPAPLTAQQQSLQNNSEGIQPVPLMVPEQAPAQGLGALGELAGGQGLQQAAQVAQGQSQPQSLAGNIGQTVGQFVKPSNIAMAAITPNMSAGNFKATGPFTAGLKSPSTALPGALESAGQQLGKAESEVPQAAAEVSDRLRRLYSAGKAGIAKLSEEGVQLSRQPDSLTDKTAEELLAYRDALIKKSSEGGRYADDYVKAAQTIESQISTSYPHVMDAIKNYALNAMAKQGSNPAIPWFTGAINPALGVVKFGANLLQSAPVMNAAGAATNIAGQNAGQLSSGLLTAYQRLAKKKGQ